MKLILDYIENLELTDTKVDQHFDSLMALARLGEGLFWLYQEVSKIEFQIHNEAIKDNTQIAVVGGILDKKPMGLLSCAYQWYAISACNYAHLVGWLVTQNANSAKDYIEGVMPRLLKYRHKVAAHFALTEPRDDNEADLMASVMTQIIYIKGFLFTAALIPFVKSNGKEITTSRDISWSLTRTHQRLIPRYWPNGPQKSYQALRIPAGETIKFDVSMSDLFGNNN
jgi:hypothetical protein